MGRINTPRGDAAEQPFPMSAYTAGFLAFISTNYVLLNREPLGAALIVGACWILGLLLLPKLGGGRWRVVVAYFAELRAYERATVIRDSQPGAVKSPGAEEVELSEQEREQFAKLMGDAGFDSSWPKG